jgi:hypothetical protein
LTDIEEYLKENNAEKVVDGIGIRFELNDRSNTRWSGCFSTFLLVSRESKSFLGQVRLDEPAGRA